MKENIITTILVIGMLAFVFGFVFLMDILGNHNCKSKFGDQWKYKGGYVHLCVNNLNGELRGL